MTDEIAETEAELLKVYTDLGRYLATPAVSREAEIRRKWSIDMARSEIGRLELLLVEMHKEDRCTTP